jgi:hypothetical protein
VASGRPSRDNFPDLIPNLGNDVLWNVDARKQSAPDLSELAAHVGLVLVHELTPLRPCQDHFRHCFTSCVMATLILSRELASSAEKHDVPFVYRRLTVAVA